MFIRNVVIIHYKKINFIASPFIIFVRKLVLHTLSTNSEANYYLYQSCCLYLVLDNKSYVILTKLKNIYSRI